MNTHAPISLFPKRQPEPGVELLFYSPDEKRAHRLSARLRNLASVRWADTRTAMSTVSPPPQRGSPLVLLDYSPDTVEESSALARRLMSRAPGVSLIGVGSTREDQAVGVLAALRVGVHDFLDLDATDDEIRTLLTHVQVQIPPAPVTLAPAPRARGRMVVLLGVRPGVGTSTLAAHLGALALPCAPAPAPAERQALLLDLGRPAGDVSLYLGVESGFHYDDALRSARRIDATLIRTALGHHISRLLLLSQAAGTLEPPRADADLETLIGHLREHVDALLCDVGGLAVTQIPAVLLREADEIWLIADQAIGSVVSLDAALRELERLGLRDQRLSLVINRYDEDSGVPAVQIAERFKLPLLAVLPERARVLRGSANQGQLLHQVAPRDPYVRALKPLLEKFLGKPSPTVGPAGWTQWIHRMGGFRWKIG
ncbi:AAA family ATPase [Rhodanobacter sp. Col0626]|uniref:AAA family ATPase n=1 Tax=Rhodanobacter sp. Col0626 TaxID=3415679 RepID=UPI003CF56A60